MQKRRAMPEALPGRCEPSEHTGSHGTVYTESPRVGSAAKSHRRSTMMGRMKRTASGNEIEKLTELRALTKAPAPCPSALSAAAALPPALSPILLGPLLVLAVLLVRATVASGLSGMASSHHERPAW